MCEKEAEFVNKTFNLCSFYLQEENIIELIKEINETIKTINSISKITDINIKIYTTINVNIISNIINVENVIHVKNVIELLEKMDYNLYYQIAKKLGLLEKYEEDDVIKKLTQVLTNFLTAG